MLLFLFTRFFLADDVLERMMDDRTATDFKLLTGHCGPVYAVSFSPDRTNLISASQDGTGQCGCFLLLMCTVCVLLLLWPSRLFCGVLVAGFLHISVAMAIQIILWVLVYFCCCGPPDHCVGFLRISVAVTLQIIL